MLIFEINSGYNISNKDVMA